VHDAQLVCTYERDLVQQHCANPAEPRLDRPKTVSLQQTGSLTARVKPRRVLITHKAKKKMRGHAAGRLCRRAGRGEHDHLALRRVALLQKDSQAP